MIAPRSVSDPDDWIERHRRIVDTTLGQFLAAELADAPAGAREPILHAVLAPGKRIRPLLTVGGFAAAGGDPEAPGIHLLGCAVELVHAYSLIHDDLPCMDDDALRRGQPTVHVRFGVPAAVLAGASLMPTAMRAILAARENLGLGEDPGCRLVEELAIASGAGGMVGGQLLDLEAEGRPVDRGQLERIHLGKTARLIEAACVMGGTAAGAGPEAVARLREFGRSLGLAFQVVDDILDVTGSTQQLGKPGGRDEALGKATMPALLGVPASRELGRELVRRATTALEGLPEPGPLNRMAHLVIERKS